MIFIPKKEPNKRALAMYRYRNNHNGNSTCKVSNQIQPFGKDREFVFLATVKSEDYKSHIL